MDIMSSQTLDAPVGLSRLLEMANSGLPIDFCSFSDKDFLLAMQHFSAFASQVFEGVEQELQQRNRGVMHCAKCGKIELMRDPECKILPHWKPISANVLFYVHVCEDS